jgi:hypothetical protein
VILAAAKRKIKNDEKYKLKQNNILVVEAVVMASSSSIYTDTDYNRI